MLLIICTRDSPRLNETQIRFNPNLLDLIPEEQLDADFGGKFEYEFEPVSYWEQIVE